MARMGICMRNVDEDMHALFLDVVADDVEDIRFTYNLNEMKRVIGEKVIAVRKVTVEGVPFRVVTACDADVKPNEGASNRKVSAISPDGKVVFRGNLLFLASYKDGEDEVMRSLNATEMVHLKDHVALVDIGTDKKYNTYAMCDVELI